MEEMEDMDDEKRNVFYSDLKKSVFQLQGLQGLAYFAVRKEFILNYPLHKRR
jgi:hypothetical protein